MQYLTVPSLSLEQLMPYTTLPYPAFLILHHRIVSCRTLPYRGTTHVFASRRFSSVRVSYARLSYPIYSDPRFSYTGVSYLTLS